MKLLQTLATGVLSLAATAVNAEIIDFVDMTEKGIQGESAWTSLNISTASFDLSITARKNGAAALAYLDWSHAGLGVCGSSSQANINRTAKSTNVCNPSSDDNVTVAEDLTFVFSKKVSIDKIWFNNTHDPDFTIDAGDLITVAGNDIAGPGNGYALPSNRYNTAGNRASLSNYLGAFTVNANQAFTIAYKNEQFYVSGMEVTLAPIDVQVPEPSSLILLGLGVLGMLGLRQRR